MSANITTSEPNSSAVSHADEMKSFLDESLFRELACSYEENKKDQDVNLGFNAFSLISDLYYRENFHSDIITSILNPKGSHHQGNLYLKLFLEFLRDHHHVKLRMEDYQNAVIERESGRIDLLIYDQASKRAIIFENKINAATDMDRQVVRYLEKVEDTWRYQCDAIVYLTLNHKKKPDTTGWTDAERDRVRPLLKSITAYDKLQDNLYEAWLKPCVNATENRDVALVIQQYSQLIVKLGKNAMNNPVIENYYHLMHDEVRYKTALSIASLMNEFSSFRCQKLISTFQNTEHPFSKLWAYHPTLAIFQGLRINGGRGIKLDVETSQADATTLKLWDNDDRFGGALPKKILLHLELVEQFDYVDGQYVMKFDFPGQETELYLFVEEFLKKLSQLPNSLS